jgi:predicted HNH restriction endonuclease
MDSGAKSFQLDLRSLSNRRWSVITEEAKKCILLCSNCHAELHNPGCLME